MRRIFPGRRRAITLAVLAGISFPIAAQDSAIDAPSPVQVIDRDSIEAQGVLFGGTH